LDRYLGKNTQPWFLYGAEIEPEALPALQDDTFPSDPTYLTSIWNMLRAQKWWI
jgi:hypothetical protein